MSDDAGAAEPAGAGPCGALEPHPTRASAMIECDAIRPGSNVVMDPPIVELTIETGPAHERTGAPPVNRPSPRQRVDGSGASTVWNAAVGGAPRSPAPPAVFRACVNGSK